MWDSDSEMQMALSKVKFSSSTVIYDAIFTDFFKKTIFRGVFRTLLNIYNEVFSAEIVTAFQQLAIFAKELRHSCLA